MKKYLKKIKGVYCTLLRDYRDLNQLKKGVYYDALCYKMHAVVGRNRKFPDLQAIEAQMIKQYHGIEKGLSMPEFRPGSSQYNIKTLVRLIDQFLKMEGSLDNRHFGAAVHCLDFYVTKHQEINYDISNIITDGLRGRISHWLESINSSVKGGVDIVNKETFFAASGCEFTAFSESRRSCRHFEPNRAITSEDIEKILNIAIQTPSVCNRQAWKLHVYDDQHQIKSLLSHQNGNRGFGHLLPNLMIITMDIRCFDGAIERYQPWIDGGMFGMNILLALHHMRVGAVPLNWSVLPEQDLALHQVGLIPEYERIVMLIGVGYPADEISCCSSQRRALDEVLRKH